MPISIKAVSQYIPNSAIDLASDYSKFGLSNGDAKIYSRFYGLEKIPYTDQSILELMLNVSRPLLQGIDLQKVKYVLAPRTAPVISPFGMSLVRDLAVQLGLSEATPFAIGMNKCVSTLRAFEVAHHLLSDGPEGSLALIVTGESVFTEQNRVLPNITITADGSAACLVNLANDHSEHQLSSMSTNIIGEYAEGVWMTREKISEFGKIFNESMAEVIRDALQQANINILQVKAILPHNVNIPCWRGFAKYFDIPIEKIYLKNIPTNSHCFNSDLLMNLSTAIRDKTIQPGDYYVMATVGVGAMFGAAVFRY